MSQFDIDPDDLGERIEEAVKRQKKVAQIVFFAISMGLFILFSFMSWGALNSAGVGSIDAEQAGAVTGAMVMMSVGWGMSLLYQFITLAMNFPAAERQARTRMASRLFGEAMADQVIRGRRSKTKRREDDSFENLSDEPVTIGDDGEIIPEREARQAKK